ncbi:unnamed protein product [Effrenium voratum]|nr:unnamed protein product [Effrenium voratum]
MALSLARGPLPAFPAAVRTTGIAAQVRRAGGAQGTAAWHSLRALALCAAGVAKARRRSLRFCCGTVQAEQAEKLVPGLRLWPGFLSEAEGEQLAQFLDTKEPSWTKEQFGVPTLYRVKHFGILGSLRPRVVRLPDPEKGEVDMPAEGIMAEVAQRLGQPGLPWSKVLKGFQPNEANVNAYSQASSRLLLHWDDRGLYEEPVCSVTVQGDCVMTFRLGGRSNLKAPEAGDSTDEAPTVRVRVPPLSLLVLRGAARYEWQHGIPETEDFLSERRTAIIFRRVRGADQAKARQAEGLLSGAERPHLKAMVISTNWPDPEVSAAGRVTSGRLRVLRRLAGEEGAITFASPARPGNAQGKLSAANDVKCIRIRLNDEASVLAALEAAGPPSLVLFDGFNAEERFGHYVHEALPDAMRVLDMQDFHALRLGREQLVAEGASAEAVATFRPAAGNEDLQRELAAIHRCDATLAISEDERRLLLETYGVPGWKVFAAPFGFKPSSSTPGFAARDGAMFIGNWRHRPNRDCARWLIQEVWPLVRRELPDEELNVFGANQTPADAALSDPSRGAFVRGYCRSVEAMMRRHKAGDGRNPGGPGGQCESDNWPRIDEGSCLRLVPGGLEARWWRQSGYDCAMSPSECGYRGLASCTLGGDKGFDSPPVWAGPVSHLLLHIVPDALFGLPCFNLKCW